MQGNQEHSRNYLQEELDILRKETHIYQIKHVIDGISEKMPNIINPISDEVINPQTNSHGFLPSENFLQPCSWVNGQVVHVANSNTKEQPVNFMRAGLRKNIFFHPSEVKAAIVTCGGLCPGLNVVIRELVMILELHYGVKEIYGIRDGYHGFFLEEWKQLTFNRVKYIHNTGGTILGSSRGGFDLKKIVDSIENAKLTHVFCVGGDGTQRGALAILEEVTRRKLKTCVIGIPKTIDNDISYIDRSFGFDTCVCEAQKAIKSADVEANSVKNGVGIVKLMGRFSGHITLHASLASRVVNLCLIPELTWEMYGPNGVLEYVYQRLLKKSHCVITIAEGCAENIKDVEVKVIGKDESGNILYEDPGLLLKKEIKKYLTEKGISPQIKYIDPTYMIRTTECIPSDNIYCTRISHAAVHSGMAGYTGFISGIVSNYAAMLPFELICKTRNDVNLHGVYWRSLLCSTMQPTFVNSKKAIEEKTTEKQADKIGVTDSNQQAEPQKPKLEQNYKQNL